jgi:ParB-like chromosome segregation protein Spo0J
MLLFDTKKTAQKGREILKTSDYTLFRTIEGNRNINLLHLNRLRQSMLEKYLFTIIIVNENMEIIDGQHRFTVCRELGLPVYYVICQDYGLAEVHRPRS